MRQKVGAVVVVLSLGLAACGGSGGSTTAKTTDLTASANPAHADPTLPCAILTAADFAAAGVTLDQKVGEDVSRNFTVATKTSAACQWTNLDRPLGGSWELVVGTGDATSAFKDSELAAEADKVKRLAFGDDAYIVDKVFQLDQTHSFEAGVRKGDTFFTLSTTDSTGAAAIEALAQKITERLG